MKSDTQSMFGRGASKTRFTRSSGHGTEASRMNEEVAAVLADGAVRERLEALVAIYEKTRPSEVDAFYARERETWIPVVREAVGRG